MTLPTGQKLLVISFDDPLKAQEFLLVAARLQKDGDLQLHDAVIVNRNADGSSRVTETTDVTPTRGALGGGVWGLLLGTLFAGPLGGLVVGAASAGGGVLYAKLVDTGIKDGTVAELRTAVPPGRTALALLVSHVSLADLQRELARFPGAALVETDLPQAAVVAVQEALAEANRRPFTDGSGWIPPTGPADATGNASPSAQS
jgi:uncharacterized membrane protein